MAAGKESEINAITPRRRYFFVNDPDETELLNAGFLELIKSEGLQLAIDPAIDTLARLKSKLATESHSLLQRDIWGLGPDPAT